MVLSAATAIYIGSTSCSEAYVGDILVWPHCHYTVVEWIKGSGSSGTSRDLYIELPFKTSSTLSFRFKGQLVAYTGGGHITGLYSADTYDYRWFVPGSPIQYLDIGNKRISQMMTMSLNTPLDYKIGNMYVYDNLTQSYVVQGTPVADVPNTENLFVRIPLLRVEAFQAWENGTLIFDGLPAYSDCDGKYGIYDSLGGGFYTSDDTITGGSSPAPTTGYTLTRISSVSELASGDDYVLICPNNKLIVGEVDSAYRNIAFSSFTGSGVYASLPQNSTVFIKQSGTRLYRRTNPYSRLYLTELEPSILRLTNEMTSASLNLTDFSIDNNVIAKADNGYDTALGYYSYVAAIPTVYHFVTNEYFEVYKLTTNT